MKSNTLYWTACRLCIGFADTLFYPGRQVLTQQGSSMIFYLCGNRKGKISMTQESANKISTFWDSGVEKV